MWLHEKHAKKKREEGPRWRDRGSKRQTTSAMTIARNERWWRTSDIHGTQQHACVWADVNTDPAVLTPLPSDTRRHWLDVYTYIHEYLRTRYVSMMYLPQACTTETDAYRTRVRVYVHLKTCDFLHVSTTGLCWAHVELWMRLYWYTLAVFFFRHWSSSCVQKRCCCCPSPSVSHKTPKAGRTGGGWTRREEPGKQKAHHHGGKDTLLPLGLPPPSPTP